MRANLFAALIGLLCVAGCGGGSSLSGGGGGGGGGGSAGNVQSIIVDSGPSVVANSTSPAINTAYTTVTICAPGSTSVCQTIDHIQVDTGSAGLRILSEVLTISLPVQKDTSGNVIAECVPFVDGSSWGPVRQADVKIAGETALNQEVQIIGDTSYTVPSTCTGTGGAGTGLEDTVAKFGANGILGVAPYVADCGGACTVQSSSNTYYTCATATTCAQNQVAENLQVSNPVAAFTTDNNGVIIQLPSVPTSGSASVTGSLIFGIGTQSNNGLGTATVFNLDSNGFLATGYKAASTLHYAFIDSGSNGYYFHDPSITPCTTNVGFYCPPSDQALQANIINPVNNASKSVSFTVTNADSLFKNAKTAIGATSGLAGDSHSFGDGTKGTIPGDQAFDWGLPFHYGKSVFVVIEGKVTSSGTGPFFAF